MSIVRRLWAAQIVAATFALGAAVVTSGHAAGGSEARRAVAPAPAPRPITLRAADGLAVSGLVYSAANPRATILLFHQAGSSKGEYATIAPVLAAAGYDAIAIDQRSGGGLFGRNVTAAALGRPASYAEARRDLDAAFAWAERRGKPVVLWGSSYSAALVFQVAAAHPGKVAALLAFSPGEYLGQPTAVRSAAAKVTVPIYVTTASDAGEIAAAKAIVAAAPSARKTQVMPKAGVHGSSTLLRSRNPAGAAANMRSVLAFLERTFPR